MVIRNLGRTMAALLLMAVSMACAPGDSEKAEAPAKRQKIIVEFAVPEGPGGNRAAPPPTRWRLYGRWPTPSSLGSTLRCGSRPSSSRTCR